MPNLIWFLGKLSHTTERAILDLAVETIVQTQLHKSLLKNSETLYGFQIFFFYPADPRGIT